jgi:hypothetical protein
MKFMEKLKAFSIALEKTVQARKEKELLLE